MFIFRHYFSIMKLLLFFCGAIWLLSAFWPGAMFFDSIVQYRQALFHSYGDQHPPIMAWVWSWLLLFGNGPTPMLLCNFIMLFGSVALLYWASAKKSPLSWIWLLMPLFPFIACQFGIILKDTAMGYALLLAFALFHLGLQKQPYISYVLFFFAACFFLYGFLLRHNAIMAVAPIIYYLIRIGYPNWKKSYVFIVSCIILFFLYGLGKFVNYSILDAEKENTVFFMYVDEIAATSRLVQKNLFSPESPVHMLPIEHLPLLHLEQGWKFYRAVKLDEDILKRNWYWVIKEEPWAYLKAKWVLFKNFSGFPLEKKGVLFYGIEKNEFGFTFKPRITTLALRDYIAVINVLRFPFLPIFWIPLAIGIFLYAMKFNNTLEFELRMLSGSAICYYFGYFLVTPTPEYRFIYWTIIATTTATLLLICNVFLYNDAEQ